MDACSQPLDSLMNELGLTNHNLVAASAENLTHKQVSKARQGRKVTSRIQKKVLAALAACAGKHQEAENAEESQSFLEEIGSYFDQLDFEADLDYSPLEELEEKTNNPAGEESKGGLILPGQ